MIFQILGAWFLEGHVNTKYKFTIVLTFFILMKTWDHIFWHAMDKHENNTIHNCENI